MIFLRSRSSTRPPAKSILRVERLDDRVMPSVGVKLAGGMPLETPGAGPAQIQTYMPTALGGAPGGVLGDSITRSSGEEIPQ